MKTVTTAQPPRLDFASEGHDISGGTIVELLRTLGKRSWLSLARGDGDRHRVTRGLRLRMEQVVRQSVGARVCAAVWLLVSVSWPIIFDVS